MGGYRSAMVVREALSEMELYSGELRQEKRKEQIKEKYFAQ